MLINRVWFQVHLFKWRSGFTIIPQLSSLIQIGKWSEHYAPYGYSRLALTQVSPNLNFFRHITGFLFCVSHNSRTDILFYIQPI